MKKYLFIAALVGVALAGCKKDKEVAVTGISVSPASVSLNQNVTQQLTVTIVPDNAANKQVTWNSSNNARATVSTNGLVTIPADATAGEVIITATTAGGKTANCTITVTLMPSITGFSPTEAQHGATITITGKNFSAVPSENSVTFNGVAAAIISAIPTEIKATIPKNQLCTGTVRVTVAGKTAESATPFTYLLTVAVSTLAGDGTYGFANGTGTAAQFRYPYGVVVDASGNVYVADYNNHRIRRITPAGVVSTFAGSGTEGFANGTGASAQFNSPVGIALDASGNMYVADSDNHRIRKITPAGAVTTLAGSGTYGFADGTGASAQFKCPHGVAVDASGNVYVADRYNHCIRKITPAGAVTTLAGSGTEGFADGTSVAAQFKHPYGVAVDASGNVYVADTNNDRIRKITPAGAVTTLAGGNNSGFADGVGAAARFTTPTGITIDAAGNLYVAEYNNQRIRRITPAGAVTTLAGSGTHGFADGTGATAQFYSPFSVALDASGNIYVGDSYNNRIRKIEIE